MYLHLELLYPEPTRRMSTAHFRKNNFVVRPRTAASINPYPYTLGFLPLVSSQSEKSTDTGFEFYHLVLPDLKQRDPNSRI